MYTVRIIRGGIEPDLYLTKIEIECDTFVVNLKYSEIVDERQLFPIHLIQKHLNLIILEGITVEITEN